MQAASNMSRITLLKSSFSFEVSSHLVRGSLSFTSSSASIFSLFGFICVRQGVFQMLLTHQQLFEASSSTGQKSLRQGFNEFATTHLLVCDCHAMPYLGC